MKILVLLLLSQAAVRRSAPSSDDPGLVVRQVGNAWVNVDGGSIGVSNFPATYPVTDNGGSLTTDSPQLPSALDGSGYLKTHEQGTATISGTVAVSSAPSTAVTNAGLSNLDVALSTRTKPADQQHVIVDTIPSTAVTNSGLTNLDVALSTRTKPADQQHTIIDSSASIGVTGPLTDTQLRATPVPVSGTVTAAVAGATLGAGSAVIGHVIVDTAPSTAVTGSFYQATQPISGTVTDQGQDPGGTARTVQTDTRGVLYVQPLPAPTFSPSFNMLLQRCNPVRRTNCQP